MLGKLKRSLYRTAARCLQHILDESHAWKSLEKKLASLKDGQKTFKTRQERLAAQQEHLASQQEQLASRHGAAAAHQELVSQKLGADLQSIALLLKQSHAPEVIRTRFGTPPQANNGRSVVFVGQSYYHFFYLARALRARGWDAVLVSDHSPSETWAKYFHGQDVHLWHEDPATMDAMRRAFFDLALGRFQMAHFAGDGLLSFHPDGYGEAEPSDMATWLDHGKFVGFTISGCNTGVSKGSVARWSGISGTEVCSRCKWNDVPEVCAPEKSLDFGRKLQRLCSLICGETAPRLDFMDSPKSICEPLTMCVNSSLWCPGLVVPDAFRIENPNGDVLVYHGVGEYDTRTAGTKNIKGTSAIVAAIERLQSEGHGVRLVFTTGMRNLDVRFRQVQADIIVDQLNHGRYGAQAREGMMLGKPVICHINQAELSGDPLSIWDDCPIVSASEETIYEKLKELVLDKAKRIEIGRASREYALKWHSPDACAARYEMVYDAIASGVSDFGPLTRSLEWQNAHLQSLSANRP